MTISEELELDVSPALAALRDIDDSFSEMVSSFRATLADAVQDFDASPVSASVIEAGETGAAGVTESLNEALGDVNADPVGEAISTAGADGGEAVSESLEGAIADFDASNITEEVESSIQGADTDIEAKISDVDASQVAPAIEAAAEEAHPQVEVTDVDASAVTEAIEEAAAAADPSTSLGALNDQASAGASAFGDLASSGLEAAGAMKVAEGASGLLTGGLAGTVSKAGPAGVALAGLGLGVKVLYDAGAEAAEVQARLNRLLGEAAPLIEEIDVGGLNTDISTLAIDLGATDESFRNAIGNFVQFARMGGIAQDQTIDTSKSLVALAANAVALRPELGDAGKVAETMGNAFIRGGRALQPYGIELSKTEIAAHAVAMGLAETEEAVSNADRVVAGADLAMQKYGDSIAKNVGDASETAAVRSRSLQTAVGELIETLGGPVSTALSDTVADTTDAIQFLMDILGSVSGALDKAGFSTDGLKTSFVGALLPGRALFDLFRDNKDVTEEAATGTERYSVAVEDAASKSPALTAAIAEATGIVSQYATTVNTEVPGVGATLGKLADDHVTSFAKIRDAFAEQLVQEASFITNIQTIITNGAPEVAKRVLELGVTRGAALAEALAKNKVDQLAQLESQALEINEVERKLSDTEADAKIQALAAGIAKRMNIPKEAALAMIRETGGAAAAEAKPQGEKTGISFADGTGGGVISRRGDLENAGRGAAAALGAGKGTANAEGREVGNNFVSGLVSVLRAGASGAIAAAARAAGAAMKPAANAGQHAKSPSKDGKEVGANFINGVAAGFEERKAEALRKLEAISAQFARAAGEGLAEDFGSTRQIARAPDWISDKDEYLKNARESLGEFGDALTVTYDGELRAASGFENLIQVFEDGSARWASSDYWNKPKELETNIRGATAALKELQSQNLMTFQTPNLQAFSQASAAAGGSSKTISGTGAEDNSVHITELNVTLHTIYDPSDPMSRRRAGQEIEAILAELSGERD